MNEQFLAYLWKYRYFSPDLKTESGDPLTILHPGDQNSDSGPDFFNARLRIGSTTWAGNVEIHVNASDWYRHGHHTDPAYDRVILHVVYEPDRSVYHQNGVPVQTLLIRNQFPPWIFERYQQMMLEKQWIPCGNQLVYTDHLGFRMWAPALAVERLEYKTTSIRKLLSGCGNDWEEAFYRHLAGSFGFKINSIAFELLAKSLPLKIVRQHCDNMFQLEALLFGQAGMLTNHFSDLYPKELLREYRFLSSKYNLNPVSGGIWKFLRLRPSNFPTIRISQFASFLGHTKALFFNLIEGGSLYKAISLLKLTASDYWNTHYVFDKPALERNKTMGPSGIRLIMINGLAPFLFFYGLEKDQPGIGEGVLAFLEKVSGENNFDIDRWKEVGFPVDNAVQSQALLHLKHFYCDKKRCLDCRIGNSLLVDNN
jgi:hypothetical protein